VEVQKTVKRMEAIGFEKFVDYGVVSILFTLNKFIWDLEDHEKALKILLTAEKYAEPSEKGLQIWMCIKNHIQSSLVNAA